MGRTATVTEYEVIAAVELIERSGNDMTFTGVSAVTCGGRSQVLAMFHKVMTDRLNKAISLGPLSQESTSVLKKEEQRHVSRNNATAEQAFQQYQKHQAEILELIREADFELARKETEIETIGRILDATRKQTVSDKLASVMMLRTRDEQLRLQRLGLDQSRQELAAVMLNIARLQYLDEVTAELKRDLDLARAEQQAAGIRASIAEALLEELQDCYPPDFQMQVGQGRMGLFAPLIFLSVSPKSRHSYRTRWRYPAETGRLQQRHAYAGQEHHGDNEHC